MEIILHFFKESSEKTQGIFSRTPEFCEKIRIFLPTSSWFRERKVSKKPVWKNTGGWKITYSPAWPSPPSITDFGLSFLAVMTRLFVCGVERGEGSDFWLVRSHPLPPPVPDIMDIVSGPPWLLTSRLSDIEVERADAVKKHRDMLRIWLNIIQKL